MQKPKPQSFSNQAISQRVADINASPGQIPTKITEQTENSDKSEDEIKIEAISVKNESQENALENTEEGAKVDQEAESSPQNATDGDTEGEEE